MLTGVEFTDGGVFCDRKLIVMVKKERDCVVETFFKRHFHFPLNMWWVHIHLDWKLCSTPSQF